MATTKITFANKTAVVPPGVRVNQVWDADINEIKDAINKNADVQIAQENIIAAIAGGASPYSGDFTYTSGPQTFTVPTGIIVKNVFRGRVKLFNNEFTVVAGVVTITYDTLESGDKISITN